MKNRKASLQIVSIVLMISMQGCLCLPFIGMLRKATATPAITSTNTQQLNTPNPGELLTSTPQSTLTADNLSTAAINSSILTSTKVPLRDFKVLAQKYFGINDYHAQLIVIPVERKIGDQQSFDIFNDDTEENSTITATLRYITDHVYFWTENSLTYNLHDIKLLCDDFEKRIYPNDRKYFGSEWTPGVDNDVHLYIVYSGGLGTYVGGYFSSDDEISTQINTKSNMHEMFYINADGQDLASSTMLSVFAHEFTHMIEYNNQRNTETWWSEGTARLAEYINGFDQAWLGYSYLVDPNIPLTKWTAEMSEADPYYAGAYLFLVYLYERFGASTLQKILQENSTGIDHLDKYFKDNNVLDSLTGKTLTANDVFGDWEIANLVTTNYAVEARYNYHGFRLPIAMEPTTTISICPTDPIKKITNQFGADFIEINCQGDYTISFTGKPVTRIISADPHSGSKYFWSNLGNESSMTMTHDFDFSNVNGKISMDYWDWYDLEKEYDYVYFLATTDNNHWDILNPSNCRNEQRSFGCGLTGKSNGWEKETLDLSSYSGKKVKIQIDYQTDLAINNEGYLIDDVSIPAIQYSTDFEKDDGGWIADGFARIGNAIPQDYVISVVIKGEAADIRRIRLDEDSNAQIPFSLKEGELGYIIASPVSRYSQLPAEYTIQILKLQQQGKPCCLVFDPAITYVIEPVLIPVLLSLPGLPALPHR